MTEPVLCVCDARLWGVCSCLMSRVVGGKGADRWPKVRTCVLAVGVGLVALGFFGVVGEVGGDADEVRRGGGLGGGDGAFDGSPLVLALGAVPGGPGGGQGGGDAGGGVLVVVGDGLVGVGGAGAVGLFCREGLEAGGKGGS